MNAGKMFLIPSYASLSESEFHDSIQLKVLVVVIENRKKATGNPYPRRGQIRKRIFTSFMDRIASNSTTSTDFLPESGQAPVKFRRSGKGNPYPRRGAIKIGIFKELFQ